MDCDKMMIQGGNFGGMSLRDWFAGQALAALGASDITNEMVASYSYQLADAMLAERDK